MVFQPSLGSCKFILKVSILRDVIITWKLSLKIRQPLKVAGCFLTHLTFWQSGPPFFMNSCLSAEKSSSVRTRIPPHSPDFAVWKAVGLNHSIGPVAILLLWFIQALGCLVEPYKKMSPPGTAIAISCPSGKPLILCTGPGRQLIPIHWRLV